ncbi:MAG: EVE domain-containing protein [Lewinellaceae bacterium]|nr:EVE domain-containing protein [Lewinellaceae bacterium]
MKKLQLEELNRYSVEEFKRLPKTPIVIVLDNIRSALNVGSIFRTADAFALQGIHLCGITAQPPHREILKTAIGATESVDWQYFPNPADSFDHLRREGYRIIGIEQTDASTPLQLFQTSTDQPCALVFGNEVGGLSDAILPQLDACIEIPQFGTKHSLNVAVCVGIVVWTFFQFQKMSAITNHQSPITNHQSPITMTYWLVKSEPFVYSYDDLLRDGVTDWSGVRNYGARNHLRAMKKGDLVLYYHSREGLEVVGIAQVVREHYPDPTAEKGDWSAVDLAPYKRLTRPVSLQAIKQEPGLANIGLVRIGRLSVMPLEKKEFFKIAEMGDTKL